MERKELAKKIAEHFDTKAKYIGPPTFAFEIKTENETYTIDRQGIITTSEGAVMEADEILCEKDSVGSNIEDDGENTIEDNIDDSIGNSIDDSTGNITEDGIEVSIPADNHSVASLVNIINMISAKQELIKKAFGTTDDFMDKDFASDLSNEKTDTIEEFKMGIVKIGYSRCRGFEFDFDEGTITFRLKGVGLDADKTKAFMELCASIADHAKRLKHSSYKPVQDDNPKYAMRTWLIRLGMIGDEYKQTRKTILSNLGGSGAYRREEGGNGNG